MRIGLSLALVGLGGVSIASIPRDTIPQDTTPGIEVSYEAPTHETSTLYREVPTEISDVPADAATVLKSLDQVIQGLEYQFENALIPLLDYGMQNPERTKPGLYCIEDHCALSISFQEARRLIPDIEEYSNLVDNYRLLEQQTRELGLSPQDVCQSDDCTLHLPELTLFDNDAVLTFKGPHDCSREIVFFDHSSLGKEAIQATFPTCTPRDEYFIGYEVLGSHLKGLKGAPRPDGIQLGYTITPRNDQ